MVRSTASARGLATALAITAMVLGGCGVGETSGSTMGDLGGVTTTEAPDATGTTPVGESTQPAPSTTTPRGSTTTASDGGGTGTTTEAMGGVPQECVDAVQGYIAGIEDVVAGFDFAASDLAAYQNMMQQQIPALTVLANSIVEAGCDQFDQAVPENLLPDLTLFAQTQAPGSVEYLEILTRPTLAEGSGCADSIEAMQTYIDAGGTFRDLAPEDKLSVTGLYATINNWCALQTGGRFLGSPEVEAFLETEFG